MRLPWVICFSCNFVVSNKNELVMFENHILIIALSNHLVFLVFAYFLFCQTCIYGCDRVEEQATHVGDDMELRIWRSGRLPLRRVIRRRT